MLGLLLAASAFAQGVFAPGEVWDNFGIDPASTSYANAVHAARTNTRVYGPVGYLDREMLPRLALLDVSDGKVHAVWDFRVNQAYGVVRVPYVCDWDETHETGCVGRDHPVLQHRPVDSISTTFGLGVRWRFLSAYYIGNTNLTHIQETSMENLLMDQVGFLYGAVLMSGVGPLIAAGQAAGLDLGLPPTQFVVGVGGHSKAIDLHAAWLFPNDLYTNVSSETVGLFAESLLEDTRLVESALERAPLLKTGLAKKALVAAVKEVGKSSAFVRKVQMVEADAVEPDASTPADASGTSFWTGHLEQAQIGNWGTVGAAFSWSPRPMLHEWHVGIDHEFEIEEGTAHVQGHVGTVRMPELPQYGLVAQQRIALYGSFQQYVSNGAYFQGGGGINEPETLTYFPYARGSLRLWFALGMSI